MLAENRLTMCRVARDYPPPKGNAWLATTVEQTVNGGGGEEKEHRRKKGECGHHFQ